MTINKLHRICAKLIEQGHGRAKVCAYKPTFSHPLESDGCVILDANGAWIQWVRQIDEDGGAKVNKDGTGSYRKCLVIVGSDWPLSEEVSL